MTADDTRLAVALALAAPGTLCLAAALRLLAPRRPAAIRGTVVATAAVLFAGLGCAVAGLLVVYLPGLERLPVDVALFTWSPLGLYGVPFALRLQPGVLLLLLPLLALAVLGGRRRLARGPAAGDAFALLAVAGAMLVCLAGDLVSLFLAVGVYFAATTAVLWCVAGSRAAGRRVVVVCAAEIGLLICVLVLGEVNGLFRLAQLSTAGFTTAPFAGVLLAALVAAPAPPFHGWLLRLARQPLAPAAGAAGSAICLTLLQMAVQVTAGQFALSWQRWLGALAWLCAAAATGVALARHAAPIRFAALFAGRAALTLLAASVATPAAMAAAALYFLLGAPFTALLWLVASATPAPPVAFAPRSPGRPAPAQRPGFWLFALLLAGAAGLPGTVGGLAQSALVGALTSWPSGDQLHRLPPLLLDIATLIAGGSLLWQRPWFAWLPRRAGWAVVAVAGAAIAVPVARPAQLVGAWFGPAAARVAGTAGSPLALSVSPVPTVSSALLGLMALWALAQSLRGCEWLPAPARTLVGAAAFGWGAFWRASRRRDLSQAPEPAAGQTLNRVEAVAGGVMSLLRPLEERYYAAGAVILAVAIVYIFAR